MHALMDWCFENNSGRTPREYPYSYDAHFSWRDFDKSDMEGIDIVYSDRMRDWDPEKYKTALNTVGRCWIENISRDAAKRLIEIYYDGAYECVGFGRCCNMSSGYGIGLFYLRTRKATKSPNR